MRKGIWHKVISSTPAQTDTAQCLIGARAGDNWDSPEIAIVGNGATLPQPFTRSYGDHLAPQELRGTLRAIAALLPGDR